MATATTSRKGAKTRPAAPAVAGDQRESSADPVRLPGRYELLPLAEIAVNPDNIRTDAVALPAIVENLQVDGVGGLLSPVIVRPNGANSYMLIDGEQRYWSAIEAGQSHIQAIVRDDLAGSAEQIISMLRQVHRKDPTAAQQARGIQQLALDGMGDDEIARRTGYTPQQVQAGRSAATLNRAAAERSQNLGLDLTQIAVVADFATDPEVVDTLLGAAEHGPFAFKRAAEEARNQRRANELCDARRAELQAAGVKILTDMPAYNDPKIKSLGDLLRDGKRLTADNHMGCPGLAVFLRVGYSNQLSETAYCTDWRAYGHQLANGTGRAGGTMTEEQKAERRTIIANNKAMEAANTVRREWLAGLLAAKTPPKGAVRFMAEMLTDSGHVLAVWVKGGRAMLDELLYPGAKKRTTSSYVPARTSDGRYGVIAIAALAAAMESQITRVSWRQSDPTVARWLRFCEDNGFQPGPVERIIIDQVANSRPAGRPLTLVSSLLNGHGQPTESDRNTESNPSEAEPDTEAEPLNEAEPS